MKKIMFLQIKGKSFGGIWLVNKTLGECFYKKGYEVQICSIRDNHPGNFEETCFKQYTINAKDEWMSVHRRDVLNSLKSGIKLFLKTFKQYLYDYISLKIDYIKMKHYINREKPNYIVASHYQTLPGIPKQYLKKTVHVQHSSFEFMMSDKKNVKTLKKYNKKIFALIWLNCITFQCAEKFGFIKNQYIYNPARITSDTNANLVNNKKIVVLSRFSPEKRIDLMVKMVDDVFKNPKYKNWKFELYGQGELKEDTRKIIEENSQIIYKGVADDVKKVLLSASFSLNTSITEGFPMSLIESFSCAVPVIVFNYGIAVGEIVKDGYNGFIVEQDDIESYKTKICELMDSPEQLVNMGENAKKFSEKFSKDKIVLEWDKLFEKIDD